MLENNNNNKTEHFKYSNIYKEFYKIVCISDIDNIFIIYEKQNP